MIEDLGVKLRYFREIKKRKLPPPLYQQNMTKTPLKIAKGTFLRAGGGSGEFRNLKNSRIRVLLFADLHVHG